MLTSDRGAACGGVAIAVLAAVVGAPGLIARAGVHGVRDVVRVRHEDLHLVAGAHHGAVM